jgi:death-on-curing protein
VKRLRWLTVRGVETIHHELIVGYGGTDGVREAGALESALARPKHLVSYRSGLSTPPLAASYGWGLLRNHPFVDGNKRIALAAMIVFLELNGWDWLATEVAETAKVLAAAAREISEREWNLWVENSCRKRSS